MTADKLEIQKNMKIALVQINSLVGDVDGNLKKILHYIQKAKAVEADLVCFHELALLGYPPRDLLELPYLLTRARQALDQIVEAAHGIAVLVGTILPNPDPIGKPLFNAAIWCEDGQIRTSFHKVLLPSYDVFDETRYFEPGRPGEVFEFKGKKVAVSICEDLWNDPLIWNRKLYSCEPMETYARSGAEVVINLSASPYSMGKFNQRVHLIRRLIEKHPAHVVYINQVGGNDELIFDGGSFVMDPDGDLLGCAPFFKEGFITVDLDNSKPFSIPKWEEIALLEEALILGLKDYSRKCGFKKVTLGLSGGIDSALVAYLAVKALGPKNVLGLMMPSRYSSQGSVADSRKLAKNLKIPVKKIPMDLIHKAYEKTFSTLFNPPSRKATADATAENIQARIRGNLLMAVSNKFGHLVLSTGNKSELAVGYCTLYGDMSGGLAVIADVPKTLVYELARHINRKKEIIPEEILTKPPSAELRPDQTDQDTLPPYEILDGIIKAAIEDLKSEEEIIKLGFPKETVQKILSMIRHNEYKRRQAAPGLRVTSKAFGMGRRYPIAGKV